MKMDTEKDYVIVGETSPDLEALVGDIFSPVRTIIYNQKVWFCFKDLYRQLIKGNGLNKNKVLSNIPEKWKVVRDYPIIDTQSVDVPFFQGTTREVSSEEEQTEALVFINVRAIFLLCLWVVSPQTQKFQEWVVGELLPELMVRGCYVLNDGLDAFLEKYQKYLNTKFYEDKVFTFSDGVKVTIRKCGEDKAAVFIHGGENMDEFPYESIPEIMEELEKYTLVAGPFYTDPSVCEKPIEPLIMGLRDDG